MDMDPTLEWFHKEEWETAPPVRPSTPIAKPRLRAPFPTIGTASWTQEVEEYYCYNPDSKPRQFVETRRKPVEDVKENSRCFWNSNNARFDECRSVETSL